MERRKPLKKLFKKLFSDSVTCAILPSMEKHAAGCDPQEADEYRLPVGYNWAAEYHLATLPSGRAVWC